MIAFLGSGPGDRKRAAAAAGEARRRARHPRRANVVLAALLLAAVGAAPAAAAAIIEAARATVIDGDTIDLGSVRVRIHGIDAPELAQRCANGRGGIWACGERAAERMAELVEGASVSCAARSRDQYGRIVAICRARGVDLGETLVREGLAWAFRRYSDAYLAPESEARRAMRGVWRADTEPPWSYRAHLWDQAAAAAPTPGCPIKGNVSRQGERIYHAPWSPWYDRTVVDEARGERWFCDEAAALEAGWRPARWR